ncbi:HlyD family secretion protein [Aquiflexum sp. TKW24L]|uniref:HlyD family secretion protein n=1 Tax=Aquiflexum sp. TKW24L TaxID=2942212 RepID=UPI0020BE7931|nr:HlyD family efflux transporter periplasmic adaptor subunit [Aquiflexum sp. TKW24L]MCL6258547.1 HlyD family secretion protein [Aquiflexum sp. TKW24L]
MPEISNPTDNLHLRSEEVQEIIATPPTWLVRWGITIVFILICLVLFLSFLIKYPDYVQAKVLVTTMEPIERVEARVSGQIEKLFVGNRQQIQAGQPLAGLKSTAKLDDLLILKRTIESTPFGKDNDYFFPIDSLSDLVFGEVEIAYLEFERAYMEYWLLKELQPHKGQLEGNQISLIEINNRIKSQISQKELLERRLRLVEIDYERNRGLHKDGIIADKDFESKEIEYLQMQEQVNNMVIAISQMQEALSMANQTRRTTAIEKQEEETRTLKNMVQSYHSLKRAVRDWEYAYLMTSSIDGIVSFQRIWGTNQQVNSDELVFTVLPENKTEFLASMKIPAQNAGKVQVGQRVLIKLDNYPFQQFGALTGKITNISISPDDEFNYLVYANLPKGTMTSYKREIPFDQELLGNAEIITEELSVAERLFFKFRSLIVY